MSQEVSLPRLDSIENGVERFLASPPYHGCLLLVHSDISVLEAAVNYLKSGRGLPLFSVGTELAKQLLAVEPRRRPTEAARNFATATQNFKPGPLLCKGIDLLFEPSMQLDPLRMLLDNSRQVSMIVAWPGSYDGRALTYAVPEHAHYRVWVEPDLCDYCVINL